MNETALVKVEDLTVHFVSRDATVNAVNGVSFELARGAGEALPRGSL
jgi:ABC-type glutathione transport system ATPase component